MIDIDRKQIIIQELNDKTRVKVKDMVKKLGVSESTVRRDFEELIQTGIAVSVYGGIGINEKKKALELPKISDMDGAIVKDKLCQAAATEVKDGMYVYVDGGTTFRTMMYYLKNKAVTVVTNNILLAMYYEATTENHAELIELGGVYDPTYFLTTGPIAVDKIQQFQFDCAFIAAESIGTKDQGVYVADIYLASVKQAAMSRSSQIFLVAEEKKLTTRSLYRFANLNEFTKIYMEKGKLKPILPVPVTEVE